MSVPTEDEIYSVLVRWVFAVTGVRVERSHEDAKRPDVPYMILNLLSSGEVRDHEQDVEYLETNVPVPNTDFFEIEAQPVIETEWRWSLNCYGPDSMKILRPLAGARKLMQVLEPMYPELILHDLSDRRHLPEIINNAYEDRAQVDIFLRGIVQDGFVVDVINAIETVIVTRQGT